MKGFSVFQKGAHRIPTLALYKSLLKISSTLSVDAGLGDLVQKRIRRQFRKYKTMFSPKVVKEQLIYAYDAHSTIERAIKGDSNALDTIIKAFNPRTPKQESEVAKPPILPPRPELSPFPSRAPTIHYASMQLPKVVYPGGSKSVAARNTFRRKLMRRRALGAIYGRYQVYLSFAEHEEDFLKELSRKTGENCGWKTECGVVEITAIVADLAKLLDAHELREDIRVYERLKRWALENPNAHYRRHGKTKPSLHQRVLRQWEKEKKKVIRENEKLNQQDAFMRKWKMTLGKNEKDVVMFLHPYGRSLKRRAKRRRKSRLGNNLLIPVQDTEMQIFNL